MVLVGDGGQRERRRLDVPVNADLEAGRIRLERQLDGARIGAGGDHGSKAAAVGGRCFKLEVSAVAVGRPDERAGQARGGLEGVRVTAAPEGWTVPEGNSPGDADAAERAVLRIGGRGREVNGFPDDESLRDSR